MTGGALSEIGGGGQEPLRAVPALGADRVDHMDRGDVAQVAVSDRQTGVPQRVATRDLKEFRLRWSPPDC